MSGQSRHAYMAGKDSKDANHDELSQLYIALGCSCIDTHTLGFGFPDAIVGLVGVTELVEFKTEDGEVSPKQTRFSRDWRGGEVRIIRSRDGVYAHVSEVRKRARREI